MGSNSAKKKSQFSDNHTRQYRPKFESSRLTGVAKIERTNIHTNEHTTENSRQYFKTNSLWVINYVKKLIVSLNRIKVYFLSVYLTFPGIAHLFHDTLKCLDPDGLGESITRKTQAKVLQKSSQIQSLRIEYNDKINV